jgi:serine/threonine protein kinase
VIHGTHRSTRQEYAIKVLDKGHLKRNNKLNTALAEKNTLVRLGSGHPGIVRLHWAFQDDWSLCKSPLSLTSPPPNSSRPSRRGTLATAEDLPSRPPCPSGCLQQTLASPSTLGTIICCNGIALLRVTGQHGIDTHALSYESMGGDPIAMTPC